MCWMTTVADDGAGWSVVLGVGVGAGVLVGVAVGVGLAVGENVADAVGSGEVVSAGVAAFDAPAWVNDVTRPPDSAVAAVSAVTRAMRRQSAVLTRPILTREIGVRGGIAEILRPTVVKTTAAGSVR